LFQGQEHIDDLDLEWDSFKWRNHQPEIGRFFNIDPLTDEYVYNSPYAFAENRVVSGRELEGLEWAPPLTADENGNFVPDVDALQQYQQGRAEAGAGLIESVTDAAEGLWNAVTSPVQTVKGLWNAVTNPVETITEIKEQVVTSFKENPEKASGKLLGNVLMTVASEGLLRNPKGIVYERIDKTGNLKPYVGQAKSAERFAARQKEHARANPRSDFEFKKIDKGKPGKNLNKKEQKALDARGGPTNKANPNGGTSNRKNVIQKKKTTN